MRISDWSSDVCSSDLHPGQRIGERPHRRRPAPAVIKPIVRCMAPRLEVGDIVVKDRRGAPDRRIDDAPAEPGVAGPIGAPSALHEFGRRAAANVVAFAYKSAEAHVEKRGGSTVK